MRMGFLKSHRVPTLTPVQNCFFKASPRNAPLQPCCFLDIPSAGFPSLRPGRQPLHPEASLEGGEAERRERGEPASEMVKSSLTPGPLAGLTPPPGG